MNRRLIIIDFEVLSNANFWMCCMKDVETGMEHTIINNRNEFLRVFNKNKNSIWIGYNIRGYDQWIIRAILSDINPCIVSDKLIKEKIPGGRIDRKLHSQKVIFFEVSEGFKSLKELELFMGESIVESNVSFDLNSYPTSTQIEELNEYCLHDVRITMNVFIKNRHEFDAHQSLIDMFNLDYDQFNRTKTQISCKILDAKRPSYERKDDFDFKIIDVIKLLKYQNIKDWYEDYNNRNYKTRLKSDVYGLTTDFGWGGIHCAVKKYKGEEFIVSSDVSSFYPSIIIEYNLLSRNIRNSEKYSQIKDKRIKLKKNNDPREYPLKIVLNSVYGACKDSKGDIYDPQVGNSICVNGQLLLLDLIEKVEFEFGSNAKLIQCNTDGIIFKFNNKEDIQLYLNICNDWSKRTNMNLDHDMVKKIIQKDVNNYIYIKENGEIKSKGAYVKELSMLDNDLPIVNAAIKNYLIEGISVEDTINRCNKLIEFQKCVKISNAYNYITYGNEKINLKVLRVFASKLASDPPVLKVKNKFKNPEKFANTPDRVFIDNENIVSKTIPEKLDKEWYINIAKKRLEDFIEYQSVTLFDLL